MTSDMRRGPRAPAGARAREPINDKKMAWSTCDLGGDRVVLRQVAGRIYRRSGGDRGARGAARRGVEPRRGRRRRRRARVRRRRRRRRRARRRARWKMGAEAVAEADLECFSTSTRGRRGRFHPRGCISLQAPCIASSKSGLGSSLGSHASTSCALVSMRA